MTPKPIIAPSILASDLSCLKDEAQTMVDAGCDWLHIDIMDGQFVPNITIGPPVVRCLRRHIPSTFFDIHLMVNNPENLVEELNSSDASQITFHIESVDNNEEAAAALCSKIRSKGIKAGIAIKPNTSIQLVKHLLTNNLIDNLLIMTVEPGFGGQTFMNNQMSKVKEARHLNPNINIQVDGGLNEETVKIAAESGANVIVAGTSMYKSKSPRTLMEYMRDVVVACQLQD